VKNKSHIAKARKNTVLLYPYLGTLLSESSSGKDSLFTQLQPADYPQPNKENFQEAV
jgi:hypothetical protein